MNQVIAVLKSTASNPSMSEARREAAVSQLRAIAVDTKDPRATDALLVLRELGCTENVQPDPKPAEAEPSSQLDPREDVFHPEHFDWLFAKQAADEQAFFEKAKADGLTAAETAAKMRQRTDIPPATRYAFIANHAEMCKRDGAYAARTYFCPVIRKRLQEIEQWAPYDWPAIELAKETLELYPEPQPQPTQGE